MLVLLYIYINSTNIPPIMIINRIYENQKTSVAVACFLSGRAKDLSAPLYLGSFFLDPDDIRKPNIEAIWKFAKGTGLL